MSRMDWDRVHREDIHQRGREYERRRDAEGAPGPEFLRSQAKVSDFIADRRRSHQQHRADMLRLWQQADEEVRKRFAKAMRKDPSLAGQQESWVAVRRTRRHAELMRQLTDGRDRGTKEAPKHRYPFDSA